MYKNGTIRENKSDKVDNKNARSVKLWGFLENLSVVQKSDSNPGGLPRGSKLNGKFHIFENPTHKN